MSDEPTRRRQPRDANEAKRSLPRFSPRAIWLAGVPFVMLPLFVGLYLLGQNPVEPLIESLANEDRLERQIQELKQENSELQQDIDALGPGQFGIEKRARERLGWSKRGEVVIHVPAKR